MADNDNSQPIIPGSSHLNEVPNPTDTKPDWQSLDESASPNPGAQAVSWGKVMADNSPGAIPASGNPNQTPEWGDMDAPKLAQAEQIAAPVAPIPLAASIPQGMDSPVSASLAEIMPTSALIPNTPVPPTPAKANKPKRKTPIVLYLVLFLLVIILGLTSLVIYLLTGGAATVNLKADNSSSQSSQTTSESQTSSVSSSTSTVVGQTDVYFYLLAYGSDNIGGVVDPSSLPKEAIKFGQEDYLVPVLYKAKLETANPVEDALEGLFAIKVMSYGAQGYKTQTYLSDIQPKVTKLSDGKTQVNLVGNIVLAGDLSAIYLQAQVEQTIKYYTSNYVVQLNGSESKYKCLNDLSGQCGSSSSSTSSAVPQQ